MSELPFIDPTYSPPQGASVPPAPRPADLKGKVIGLLDNTKEGADVILRTIGETLVARYGAKGWLVRTKETFSKVAIPDIINEMAQEADIVVSALGG